MSSDQVHSQVEKLKGLSNWPQWKFVLKTLLDSANALEVCDGTDKKPQSGTTDYENHLKSWIKADKFGRKLIVTTVESKPLELIMNCNTAHDMWEKLHSVYDMKSDESLALVQKEFFEFKWSTSSSVAQHVSRLEQLANKMKDLGGEIPESMLTTRILSTLPARFNHFHSAWDSTEKDKRTLSNLTTRLLTEELRLENQEEDDLATAMMTKAKVSRRQEKSNRGDKSKSRQQKNKPTKEMSCYTCGKRDHLRRDCPGCFECGSKYHLVKDCDKKSDKFKNKNTGSNSGDRQAFVSHVKIDQLSADSAWVIDSGASEHITNRREWLHDYKEFAKPVSVRIGDGNTLEALGQGNIDIDTLVDNKWIPGTIHEVLFVPRMNTNLFSVKKAAEKGLDFTISNNGSQCLFRRNDKTVAEGILAKGLYQLVMRVTDNQNKAYVSGKCDSLQVWHERLGHQNNKHVRDFLKRNNIDFVDDTKNDVCKGCVFGKHHRKSFSTKNSHRAAEVRQKVHSDVCGPMSVESTGKNRYYCLFKDDYSSYRKVYFIKHKSEVADKVKAFCEEVKNQFGDQIKELCTDGGKEYVNSEVKCALEERGIKFSTNIPYTPEHNGIAERENRTLMEAARSMLFSKPELPRSLWAEAVNTAVYVFNRSGSTQVPGKTPLELWDGKQQSIKHLKVFGTKCFIHIPKEKRRKLDKKAHSGYFVGYTDDSKGYRVYVPELNNVLLSRDVIFETEELIVTEEEIHETNAESETDVAPEDDNNIHDSTHEDVSESETELEPPEEEIQQPEERMTLRNRNELRPPDFYGIPVTLIAETDPVTYEEAITSEHSEKWRRAMKDEINSLNKNNTWILVEKPKNKQIINNRWTFKTKYLPDGTIDRFKARLVIKGCSQKSGIDYKDTFSPVIRFETIRAIISFAAQRKLCLRQFDIKSAFLYGEISEEIYMQQPHGFEDGTSKVCKLTKSLYGLKQAPRSWNREFTNFLKQCDLKESVCDPCLYLKQQHDAVMLILLYVDDGLIVATNKSDADRFLSELTKRFEANITEKVTHFLGIEIKRESDGSILIGQPCYAKRLLTKYGMENANEVSTPIAPGWTSDESTDQTTDRQEKFPYREIVGGLTYLQVISRPDISFAVNVAARYSNNPKNVHVQLVKRILRYIKGTIYLGLKFGSDAVLETFSDADFAGDVETRKSTSGVLSKFGGAVIIWESRKQPGVALSTTEAEYVSAACAVKNIVWLIRLLRELGIHDVSPHNKLFIDNMSAIKLIKNPEFHKRTKHVDVRYHFIRDHYNKNEITIDHVPSEKQLADILTKALPTPRFQKLRSELGMIMFT